MLPTPLLAPHLLHSSSSFPSFRTTLEFQLLPSQLKIALAATSGLGYQLEYPAFCSPSSLYWKITNSFFVAPLFLCIHLVCWIMPFSWPLSGASIVTWCAAGGVVEGLHPFLLLVGVGPWTTGCLVWVLERSWFWLSSLVSLVLKAGFALSGVQGGFGKSCHSGLTS